MFTLRAVEQVDYVACLSPTPTISATPSQCLPCCKHKPACQLDVSVLQASSKVGSHNSWEGPEESSFVLIRFTYISVFQPVVLSICSYRFTRGCMASFLSLDVCHTNPGAQILLSLKRWDSFLPFSLPSSLLTYFCTRGKNKQTNTFLGFDPHLPALSAQSAWRRVCLQWVERGRRRSCVFVLLMGCGETCLSAWSWERRSLWGVGLQTKEA